MRFSLRFSGIAALVICISGASCLLSSLAAQTAPQPRILVYTRNYTPDGKGYVHDNIADSVAAIRKMGAGVRIQRGCLRRPERLHRR